MSKPPITAPAKRKARTGALLPNPRQGRADPGPGPSATVTSRSTAMGLHTVEGLRRYITAGEREAFLREANRADRTVRTLCMTLTYAECLLSEALVLTIDRVDLAAGVLTFESLRKRPDGVYHGVSVPSALLEALDMVHGIREQQNGKGRGRGVQLWPWSRMTSWRAVHNFMAAACLMGRMPPPEAYGMASG